MKVLLTYFGPFGVDTVNSSAEAAGLLGGSHCGHEIVSCLLPVSFKRCHEAALAAVQSEKPDAVICLGQAAGRAVVSLERVAVNAASAKTPDCDGCRPQGEKIDVGGPDAILTGIDVESLAERLSGAGIPAQVSNSAGTYVCNTLYYRLLHALPQLPVLFFHLPLTPRQAAARGTATPSMHPLTCADALRTVIENIASR